MRGSTRDRLIFAGAVLATSFALFALAWWARSSRLYVPTFAGYLVPALAVVSSALGVGWRRKLVALGALTVGFSLLDGVAMWTGVQNAASHPESINSVQAELLWIAAFIYGMLPLVLPLAVVVLFVGRDPSVLWTRRAPARWVRPSAARAKR